MLEMFAKREREGGWRRRIPWRRVRVERRSALVVVFVGWPRRRSRVVMSRDERLWENVSCRRKKVRNAGSDGRSARVLVVVVVLGGEDVADGMREFRLLLGEALGGTLGAERQICASIPSI
jgi:hypothetical protein